MIRWDFLGAFPTKYDGGVWWRATSSSLYEKVSDKIYKDITIYKLVEYNDEIIKIEDKIQECYNKEYILYKDRETVRTYYDGGCKGYIQNMHNNNMYNASDLIDKNEISISDLKSLGYPMLESWWVKKGEVNENCITIVEEDGSTIEDCFYYPVIYSEQHEKKFTWYWKSILFH